MQTACRRGSTRSFTWKTRRCPTTYASPRCGSARLRPRCPTTTSTRYVWGKHIPILPAFVHSSSSTHNPTHLRTQWWLCFFLQKYGQGSITSTTTGSALGSPTTTFGKIAAMKALLPANYTDWNTCMYVPVASNVNPGFVAYPGVPNQIDCAATETYAGAATFTSCDATITGGTVSASGWLGRFDLLMGSSSHSQLTILWQGAAGTGYYDSDDKVSCIQGKEIPAFTPTHPPLIPSRACLSSVFYSGGLHMRLRKYHAYYHCQWAKLHGHYSFEDGGWDMVRTICFLYSGVPSMHPCAWQPRSARESPSSLFHLRVSLDQPQQQE